MPDRLERMDAGYAYVWEYLVRPHAVADFESAYGPDGDWVRLFRRHEGYVRTELLRDLDDPTCYLTVDYWVSRAAYEAFRESAAADFAGLDARCEQLTVRETSLSRFVVLKT